MRTRPTLLRQQHERHGRERENENNDHRISDRFSFWVQFGDLIHRLGVDAPEPEEQSRPQPPPAPEDSEGKQETYNKRKRLFRFLAEQGIDDVPAVQRPGRMRLSAVTRIPAQPANATL